MNEPLDATALDIIQAIDATKADLALRQICLKVAEQMGIKEPSPELLEKIAAHLSLP